MNSSNEQFSNDKALIEKVLGGDTMAFGTVIKNTERLVAQIVSKMIYDPGDRKDIAQDIYLKAFHKLPNFQFQAKVSTWIAHIAYNTCTDHLRKKSVLLFGDSLPEAQSDGATTGDGNDWMHQKDRARILDRAIEKLPPVYRTLINLYHQQELSYLEIEAITEIPIGTVKNYLFRARKMLRTDLLIQYKREDI